jgi:hypothetical protein
MPAGYISLPAELLQQGLTRLGVAPAADEAADSTKAN